MKANDAGTLNQGVCQDEFSKVKGVKSVVMDHTEDGLNLFMTYEKEGAEKKRQREIDELAKRKKVGE